MQTAAIPYRVADFLKQHPPFQFVDEAHLVSLAARGRVKFHEPDEYICWQSSAHTPFIYVIQQGSVSLWDELVNPPALADIRGVGDCIGMERFNGSPSSLYSAKAASEVVLYALYAADFEALLPNHTQAAQYVAAYSAVTADYSAPGVRPQVQEIFLSNLVRDRASVECPASTPIQQAARLLSESGAQALALTDETRLVALLTPADLIIWIADGAIDPQKPAREIARAAVVTLEPQTLVSDCVLAMAEARTGAAALTSNGSPLTAIQGVVTASTLAPAFGDHPMTILNELESAGSVQALRTLNARARAWMLDHLASSSALDWLASWSDIVNRRILERLLKMIGNDHPQTLFCFYGAAGRQELLTAEAPNIAVFGAAPLTLKAAFTESGYLAESADGGSLVGMGLEEWKLRFSGWIRDPIRNQAYLSHPFFDLRAIHGPAHIFQELEAHVRSELAAEPGFLRILANDCLSTLPPLTFFRDLVVEETGEETNTFRLASSALQPLADVARVFGLASGGALGASTRERFERARRLLPAQESIFRNAAETMRIVLYYQARAGLRMGSTGAELPLATLSRQDRQVLKSCFRSIHGLLEFTAPCAWLEGL